VLDTATDTLVKTYSTASTPALPGNYVQHSFLDAASGRLYVSTDGGGLAVIALTSDTLVRTFTNTTVPALPYSCAESSFVDPDTGLVYVSGCYGSLSVLDPNDAFNSQGVYTKTIFSQDESFWQDKAALPGVRMSAGGGVIEGKIYIAGGVDNPSRHSLDSLISYDPATDAWTTLAPMQSTRNTPVSGVIDGKLYIAGGRDVDWNATSTLEIYDPGTDTWTSGAPMHVPRIGATGGVYNGCLLYTSSQERPRYRRA